MDAEMISPGRGGFQSTRKGRRSRLDPLVWIAIGLTLLALLAFAFTGLVAPSKAAKAKKAQGGVYCGAWITQNVTLHHDLYGCVAGGITIAKSGVTVDLNGHSITGLGEGDGIAAAGVSGVTVKNGTVRNFEAGLRFAGVQNSLVHDTRFSLNSDASAWIEASTGNKFLRLTMTENGDGGFRLIGSSKNRIAGSTISGASDSGVGLEGLSSYNRLVRNKVTLAGEGVKVDDGTGNRVFRNTLSHNGGAGVEVAAEAHATRINENHTNWNGADGIFVEAFGAQINRNHSGCNGGLGINATQLSVGKDNVAGANGDNVGCAGVVCRVALSCGAE
jgi:parallel beta-helix repeat protein